MRDKVRQWFVRHPRAMNGAYTLMLAGGYMMEIGLLDATGGTNGP
ncbi:MULTISPECIES: hypothetical protein [Halorussus]|nr:hypothetical protein [Halorussus vallis]